MRDLGAYFATQKAGAGIADDSAIAAGPYKGMKFYEVGETPVPQRRRRARHPGLHGLPRPDRRRQPGPGLSARRRPAVGLRRASPAGIPRRHHHRDATRTLFNIMATVAKPLTDEEIQSLASYLQGLHDARDDRRSVAAGTAPSSAPTPAPRELPPRAGGRSVHSP